MNRVIFEGVLDGIVVDRIIRDEEFSMPAMHFHPEYEIYYLMDGARHYFIENKTVAIGKGALVLIDAMRIHKTSAYGKPAHDRVLIELTSEPFSGFLKNICGLTLQSVFAEHAGIWALDEAGQRHVEGLLCSVINEFKARRVHYQSCVMMKIAELLLFVTRCDTAGRADLSESLPRTAKHTQIQNITEYISENFHKIKSLDMICKAFFLSKSYLCRIFKEVTGFTVQEYINMRRIQKAQELLENSDLSVSAVSSALGYRTITQFERMFRKYTETTPLRYRRKIRLIHLKVRERKDEKNLKK